MGTDIGGGGLGFTDGEEERTGNGRGSVGILNSKGQEAWDEKKGPIFTQESRMACGYEY